MDRSGEIAEDQVEDLAWGKKRGQDEGERVVEGYGAKGKSNSDPSCQRRNKRGGRTGARPHNFDVSILEELP